MAKIIVIAGDTGSGKSTSFCSIDIDGIKIKGLDPKKTFIFNTVSKEIPVKGGNKTFKLGLVVGDKGTRRINTRNYAEIANWLKLLEYSPLDSIVFDDTQYLISMDFFDSRNQAGYDKFARIGFSFIEFIELLKALPDDKLVFILMHTDVYKEGDDTVIKLKTIGKMLDEKFTLAGLFSTVLVARKKWDKVKKKMTYYFSTNPAFSSDIAKSPIGMFMKDGKILKEIPNDLGYVRECVLAYFSEEVNKDL